MSGCALNTLLCHPGVRPVTTDSFCALTFRYHTIFKIVAADWVTLLTKPPKEKQTYFIDSCTVFQ